MAISIFLKHKVAPLFHMYCQDLRPRGHCQRATPGTRHLVARPNCLAWRWSCCRFDRSPNVQASSVSPLRCWSGRPSLLGECAYGRASAFVERSGPRTCANAGCRVCNGTATAQGFDNRRRRIWVGRYDNNLVRGQSLIQGADRACHRNPPYEHVVWSTTSTPFRLGDHGTRPSAWQTPSTSIVQRQQRYYYSTHDRIIILFSCTHTLTLPRCLERRATSPVVDQATYLTLFPHTIASPAKPERKRKLKVSLVAAAFPNPS